MSRIALQGDPAGTGTFTIASPNSNNNRTLNLPDSSGTLVTTGDTIPVSQGGTGVTSITANNVVLGNGTSAIQTVAPGASGNLLTSNGTTWTSAAPASSFVGYRGQVFTGNGTFTIPTGITAVKVTVVGGGGGASAVYGGGGAGGGSAIKFLTGLTPGNTLAVTVGSGGSGTSTSSGGTGGTSQVASGTQTITTISATGGAGGNTGLNVGATGGLGSNGDANIRGQASGAGNATGPACFSQLLVPEGGGSIFGGGGAPNNAGGAYGGGAGANTVGGTGPSGAAGVVIFEW